MTDSYEDLLRDELLVTLDLMSGISEDLRVVLIDEVDGLPESRLPGFAAKLEADYSGDPAVVHFLSQVLHAEPDWDPGPPF